MEEIGDHTKYKRNEGMEFLEFSARRALVRAKRAQSSRKLSQPSYPPQKRDWSASQRRAKVWEQEAESWRSLSPVGTTLKVEGILDTVRQMYSSVFVSSQQRFGVMDIKAPSACHSSQVSNGPCYTQDLPKVKQTVSSRTGTWSLSPGLES